MRQSKAKVAGQEFLIHELPAMYIFDQDDHRMCLYDPTLDGGAVIYQVAIGMAETDYYVAILLEEQIWRATNGNGTLQSSGKSPAEALMKLLWSKA